MHNRNNSLLLLLCTSGFRAGGGPFPLKNLPRNVSKIKVWYLKYVDYVAISYCALPLSEAGAIVSESYLVWFFILTFLASLPFDLYPKATKNSLTKTSVGRLSQHWGIGIFHIYETRKQMWQIYIYILKMMCEFYEQLILF